MQGSIETADAVSQFAFEYGKQKKIEEAGAEAAVTEFTLGADGLPVMPDMPSTWTIYGAEYKKQLVNRYTNRIQTDIATKITEIASRHPTDPNGFTVEADAYLKETIKNVSPLARGLAESYAGDYKRRTIGGIVNEHAKSVRAGVAKSELTAYNLLRKDVVSTAISGDIIAAETAVFNLENQMRAGSPTIFNSEGLIQEELAKVRIDGAVANSLYNLSNIKDPVRRSKAIEAFARGKGELVNPYIISSDLSQENYLKLQGQLKTANVNIGLLEAEEDKALIHASLTKSLHFYKEAYGAVELQKIGVSDSLIKRSPSLAMTLLTQNERFLSSKKGKDSKLRLYDMLHGDIVRQSLTMPVASQDRINAAIAKITASPEMEMVDQVSYLNSVLQDEVTKLKVSIKENEPLIPINNAINAYMESGGANGGTSSTLKQTPESAKAAQQVFEQQISKLGVDTDINTNPSIEDKAIALTGMVGIIPKELSQLIVNLSNPMNPQGVVRAAHIVRSIRLRAPNAFANNLSTAIGGSLLNDLVEFIDSGGLANGGITDGAHIDVFKKRQVREYVQTEADMLAKWKKNMGSDDDSSSDSRLEIEELFLSVMEGVHDDPNWKLFPPNTQPIPAYRKAVIKTFLAMIPMDGVGDDSSYKNLMIQAISKQQANGWEDSLMMTPPGDNIIAGNNRNMAQYSPESTLKDITQSSDWAIPKIEEFASKEYNKGQKESEHIKFKFGKNLYLVPMGRNTVTNAPQFIIRVVGNRMHRTLLDSDGQPVFVPAGEMLNKRNNSEAAIVEKRIKDTKEKNKLKMEELIKQQEELYSEGIPSEKTVMGGGTVSVQEAVDKAQEELNPVLSNMLGMQQ